jgi:hypothetical protein
MVRYHGTLSWYVIMVHYHGTLSWYIIVVHYRGTLSWYVIMLRYHVTLSWYIIMVHYHGTLSWYIIMVHYRGTLSWYVIMLRYHGTLSWYIIVVHYRGTLSCYVIMVRYHVYTFVFHSDNSLSSFSFFFKLWKSIQPKQNQVIAYREKVFNWSNYKCCMLVIKCIHDHVVSSSSSWSSSSYNKISRSIFTNRSFEQALISCILIAKVE